MRITDDPSLLQLLIKVHDVKGFDFTQYKEGTLLRRIGSRLRKCGVSSYEEYNKILADNSNEMDELIRFLCINVTDFFRNPESFEAIGNVVIPRVIFSKRDQYKKAIKAWSCGCATGDEPYSLAMLLLEKLKNSKDKFDLSIIGSDIDKETLVEAKDMIYPKNKLRALDKSLIEKYFREEECGFFKLKDEVKGMVKFKHHDVIRDDPFKHCDMILCRNLLIYFNRELQEEILLKFYECLEPGGFLILGMVESLVGAAIDHFENIDGRLRIYRRPEWLTREEASSKALTQEEIDKIVRGA